MYYQGMPVDRFRKFGCRMSTHYRALARLAPRGAGGCVRAGTPGAVSLPSGRAVAGLPRYGNRAPRCPRSCRRLVGPQGRRMAVFGPVLPVDLAARSRARSGASGGSSQNYQGFSGGAWHRGLRPRNLGRCASSTV